MKVKIYNKYGIIKEFYDTYNDFSTSLFNAEKIFLKHYIIVSYHLEKSKEGYVQKLNLRSKYRKDLYETFAIDNVAIIKITKD